MSPSRSQNLFERELEVAEVLAALEEARQGSGTMLALQASAGIGKTSILQEACRRAREGDMRVLSARGSELESGFAYGVVRQLFEPALYDASPEERDRWLSGAARLAGSMFGEGATLEPSSEGGDESTYARLHGLYWLCANLARERPVLVSVDDAHWADDPSLGFLGFLLRRLEDLPVLLLVGTRPNEEAFSPTLPGLLADPNARILRPEPLSDAAVSEWIRNAVGREADAEFCRACHLATNGNPLLMRELLREVAAEGVEPVAREAYRIEALGPKGVSNVVLLRLGRLPPVAPELARAVAVLGDSARFETAAALAGLDQGEAAEAFDALVRAEVLTEGATLSFVHPIVRAAIYEELSPIDRVSRHADAARVLSERNCTPEEIAAQLLETQPASRAWAVEILREAASRALALGDAETAARHLTRALAEPPPDDRVTPVLVELGRAEARIGAPSAIEHLERAIERSSDPREAAGAALELAGLLKFAGQSVRAVEVLKAAQARLDEGDADLAERLEVELIGSAMISMDARPLLRREVDRLRDPGGAPRTFLDRATLSALAFNGFAEGVHADRVADLATRALAGGDLPTDPVAGGHVFVSSVIALMFAERYPEADRLYTEALEDAQRRGSAVSFATASSLRSLVNYRRGRLGEAHADASAALALADEVEGSQGFLSAALGTLVYTSLDRDSVDDELVELADDFLRTQASDNLPYSHAIHSRASLRIAAGELERGLEELLWAGRRELEWGAPNPAITPWRSSAALVHGQLGHDDEARRLAHEEVELARSFGAPRCLGVALRAAGVVESGERGLGLLREAVAVLERSFGELESARASIELGSALRERGERAEARDHLGRGRELASRCEATALVERSHEELLACGARPRRVALSGIESLTPSQRRVAGMAAEGMSNREIAQALFVTEKTVETHLGHVYAKLDVKARSQLPEALGAPAVA